MEVKEIEKTDTFAAKMKNVQSIPEMKNGNSYFLKLTMIVLAIVFVGVAVFFIANKNFFNIDISAFKKTDQKKNIVQIVNEFSTNKQVKNEEEIENNTAKTENIKIENEQGKEYQTEEKNLKIVVLNGGAASGMAGKAKVILENEGRKVTDVRNAQERNYSGNSIYFVQENREDAENIKSLLDKKGYSCNMEESDKFKQDGDIVILLGK